MTPKPPAEVFTVAQFCDSHGISERMFYYMRARNQGPKVMRYGRSIRISREAAERWRRQMEAKTSNKGGRRA